MINVSRLRLANVLEGTVGYVLGIFSNRALVMASSSAPQIGSATPPLEKNISSRPLPDQIRPEQAIDALQAAQDNLIEQIHELEKATPAHQTLRDLAIKDVLIVASIAFWPVMFYWLM